MVLLSVKHIVSVLSILTVGAQCGVIENGAIENSAIERRAVIGHDKITPLKQAVRKNRFGKLLMKYKPFLKVQHGCVPFPAVDKDGNTRFVVIYIVKIQDKCKRYSQDELLTLLLMIQWRPRSIRPSQRRLQLVQRTGLWPNGHARRPQSAHVRLVFPQGQPIPGHRAPARLGISGRLAEQEER